MSEKIATEVIVLLTLAMRKRFAGVTVVRLSRSAPSERVLINDLSRITDRNRKSRHIVLFHKSAREVRHGVPFGLRRLGNFGSRRRLRERRRRKEQSRQRDSTSCQTRKVTARNIHCITQESTARRFFHYIPRPRR